MHLNKHISRQFNTELDKVRSQVLVMGGLVEKQLDDAIVSMHNQDFKLAEKVKATDVKINSLEVAIDESCTRIIAKRQPAASDLRLILAIIKTITDLERIGDVAERIACMVLENANKPQPPLISLENMAYRTIKMLHDVLDAFARLDDEAAEKIYEYDKKIDQDYESVLRGLITYMMEDPRTIPHVINVLWVARSLERVGDRCQHLCEYIIYLVKGKSIRHIETQTSKGSNTE